MFICHEFADCGEDFISRVEGTVAMISHSLCGHCAVNYWIESRNSFLHFNGSRHMSKQIDDLFQGHLEFTPGTV